MSATNTTENKTSTTGVDVVTAAKPSSFSGLFNTSSWFTKKNPNPGEGPGEKSLFSRFFGSSSSAAAPTIPPSAGGCKSRRRRPKKKGGGKKRKMTHKRTVFRQGG
jgi:hypothetical protein